MGFNVAQNIDQNVLDRIARKIEDLEVDRKEFAKAGYVKDAERIQTQINAICYVLYELGYTPQYKDDTHLDIKSIMWAMNH